MNALCELCPNRLKELVNECFDGCALRVMMEGKKHWNFPVYCEQESADVFDLLVVSGFFQTTDDKLYPLYSRLVV